MLVGVAAGRAHGGVDGATTVGVAGGRVLVVRARAVGARGGHRLRLLLQIVLVLPVALVAAVVAGNCVVQRRELRTRGVSGGSRAAVIVDGVAVVGIGRAVVLVLLLVVVLVVRAVDVVAVNGCGGSPLGRGRGKRALRLTQVERCWCAAPSSHGLLVVTGNRALLF